MASARVARPGSTGHSLGGVGCGRMPLVATDVGQGQQHESGMTQLYPDCSHDKTIASERPRAISAETT